MNSVRKAISNVFRRGGYAFILYPASMLFAICLAFLSIWMIYYNPQSNLKLLQTLQLSFTFGTFLNMALCVIARKSSAKQMTFILMNIVSIIISAIAFLAVFYAKGDNISGDSAMRVIAGIAVSYLVFLIVPTYRGKKIHYNEMVFMVIKSFFIAAVYSLILMLGFFFVAFAVQSLIYTNMSSKVYSYIAILSGLLAYAFFLGYFPEFKDEEDGEDERIDNLIKQPRFAEIIFQNIMIPILAALTVVLIIWSIRILLTWVWPDYNQIIGIFSAYSLVGILLYYLVSSYENIISRLYKRIIPITTLVFLAFEAYTIYIQINLYGVKPLEYAIIFLWIFAVITSILFLFIPIIKNRVPSYIAIVLIAIFVMPVIGASDLSFTLQTKRLDNILSKNSMLVNGEIVPGSNVSLKDKEDITDATSYVFQQENRKAPQWVLKSLPSINNFESVYGFPQEYYSGRTTTPGNITTYISLRPENTPVSLETYQFYIPRAILDNKGNNQEITITTSNGDYKLTYDAATDNKGGNIIPKINITLNNVNVLSGNLDEFSSALKAKYVKTSGTVQGDKMIPLNEMSYVITGSKAQIKLVFQNIAFTSDANTVVSTVFDIQGIYFKELA